MPDLYDSQMCLDHMLVALSMVTVVRWNIQLRLCGLIMVAEVL